MTLPVIGNTTAKLAISLTAGQAKTIGFAADVDLPEGTYTLTVGETDIATTQDDARTLSVAFPAENAALLWQQWRLQLDGIDFAGGPIIETLPNNPAGDTTEPLTVNLGDSVVNLTVTIAAGGGQRYVALFVADDDYSGGTLTAATLYGTGSPVPREYVVGAPVCVVSGDDMGLWTITASGPCTPGRTVDPGDIIRAFGQGLIAVAGSSNGETVTGINVAATAARVDAVSAGVDGSNAAIAALTGTVNGVVTEVGTLTDDLLGLAKNASEAATGLALTNHADTIGTVLAWAECGWGDEVGDMVRGYWSCPVLLPTPTTSWFTRALVRSLSGSLEELNYQEVCSEPMDSLGAPGDGGAWDHDELALLNQGGAVSVFQEWTAAGDTTEWQTAQDPVVDPPYGPGVPPGRWVEIATAVPDFSTGILYLLGRTDHGTYVDPWDGDKWRILCTYDLGEPFTVEDTTAVEMWIGRGGGRFDIARVRRTYDGTLVSDFNPLAGGNGSTTIADQALLDGNSDPAIWTAHGLAVIHNP